MPVWQAAGSAEAMMNRLGELTAGIQLLQSELYRALAEEDGTPKKQFGLLHRSGEHLHALKSALDQLRRVLWLYLGNVEPAKTQAGEKLQQATELLHKLTPQSTSGIIESGSFFDRLNLVIDGYMQPAGTEAPRKKS